MDENHSVSGGRVTPGLIPSPGQSPQQAHYADAFTIDITTDATALEWLVACFEEGIPRRDRDMIFQTLAKFSTVADHTDGHVAGWRLERVTDESAEMSATGPRMLGMLRMDITPEGVRLTTAMRYKSVLGRLIWTVCSIFHRREAPQVLRRGARILHG